MSTDDNFVPVETSETQSKEELRAGPLWIIGLVGLLLIVLGLAVGIQAFNRDDIWADALLNIGVGALLFSVLLWAERRLVLKEVASQVRSAVEELRWDEEQVQGIAEDPDTPTLVDRFSDEGPIGVAYRFLTAIGAGRYEDAWRMADRNWRLCRVQAFLWNNRGHFGHDEHELNAIARDFLDNGEESSFWMSFAETERRQFVEEFGSTDPDDYGASSRRRVRGPGYELVVLIPLSGSKTGYYIRSEVVVRDSFKFLLHWEDGSWRIANIGTEAAPRAGWPPAWWIADDPAAARWEAEHGLT